MYSNNSNWVTNHVSDKSKKNKKPRSIINAGDYKITINNNYYNINPFELMQELNKLGQNNSLSKEEKEAKMRKIIKNYMR